MKTVALHTLGCKLNFSETSTLTRQLEKDGFVKKNFDENADVYIINTCSVTNNADKECRQLVRRIQRRSPESLVVITGCYAQLKPKEIAEIPGVDLVLGAAEKFNISHHLKSLTKSQNAGKISSCEIEEVNIFQASYSLNDRTRTFLKVQDGCDYNCSFCTIPLARGASRSDTIKNVIANCHELANNGIKEIVLAGINLGDFGKSNGSNKHKETFYQLICELDKIDVIERFRISSIEPNLLSNEIIEFVANSKRFMPHFHIPLQSGSDEILGLMRRRYRTNLYTQRIELIKQIMPHACIGVDVIVGSRGETNEHFNTTVNYLNSLPISYLHVFTYSERANTKALDINYEVPIGTRNERNKILRILSHKKMEEFTQQFVGQKRKVLFEKGNNDGWIEGYTDNYIRVKTAFNPDYVNNIVEYTI